MNGTTHGLPLMEPASPESLLPDYALWPWLAAAAIAVLVMIAVIIFLLRKKTPAANPQAIRKAALAEAVRALAAATSADARDAAVQASLILRKYLATVANDPALYETHEEFLARHDSLKAVSPAARAAAQAGFSRMAALKYAPKPPAVAAEEVIAESRALLETLHQGFAA